MQTIQQLFDPNKQLNREIESVVTFGADKPEDLKSEIAEYVVTDKLHNNYENVLTDLQTAFDSSSNEVGIWVAGFYGSGKSSFAKYLGLSFNRSLMIDGQTFGDKLMSRIQDPVVSALHKAIINRHNPEVIMIDLTTKSHGGEVTSVSDIVYYETLKVLGISSSQDKKVLAFIDLLYSNDKYEQFCQMVQEERHKPWSEAEQNDLEASVIISQYAPVLFPDIFRNSQDYDNITLNSAMSEDTRFERLYNLVKKKTNKDKLIYILDEVGNYIASDRNLINNTQGMMQIFKDKFRGKVWVIATAQQTLTEDNPNAQINSSHFFTLNPRFPIKVNIEASDIKEIITKRLLGKSVEGKAYLKTLFGRNEQALKLGTHLEVQSRSIYNQVLDEENFANLYPFQPVHIDILLSLLQKLASRTGGVGLRSVIRLIRDILIDNHLAEANIGVLATPEHFYDVLHNDMDRGATQEIVRAVDRAVNWSHGNDLQVRICKIIGVMQILDDFNLTFNNLCALLRNSIEKDVDKTKVREAIDQILQGQGLTLQEVEGKFQFMTNAILGIQEERANLPVSSQDKVEVLKSCVADIMSPAPAVRIYESKTITAGVELQENNRLYSIMPTSTLKLIVQYVPASSYHEVQQRLLTESTQHDKSKTLYWLCSLSGSKDTMLIDIVRSQKIIQRHTGERNSEISQYLQGQQENVDDKKRKLMQLLLDAHENSEVIFRGSPQQVQGMEKMKKQIEAAAKIIFEKYPYANRSMQSNCVNQLVQYTNLSTLPAALNPFGIVINPGTPQASIDTNHRALVAIKDDITTRGNEVSGTDLVHDFESAPYGWMKDTIRYLVSLMLKAGMIKVRANGQEYNVLGQRAAELMNTNNGFGRINIELNTDGNLAIQELLAAVRNLTAIFGSGQTSPVPDAIAREANNHIDAFKDESDRLKGVFGELHLSGENLIAQACGFAKEIAVSDGGKAPYLLGKDTTCPKVFQYVVDVKKADNQSHFLDTLRKISKIIERAKPLTSHPQIGDFAGKLNQTESKFNNFLSDPDLYQRSADVIDLYSQLKTDVEAACTEFESTAMAKIAEKCEDIHKLYAYCQLKEEQKATIDALLNAITVDFNERDIATLASNINIFNQHYVPGGSFDQVMDKIKQFEEANRPPSQGAGEPGGGNPQPQPQPQPQSQHRSVPMKRNLSSRSELQQLITQLQQVLDAAGENDTFEISLTD